MTAKHVAPGSQRRVISAQNCVPALLGILISVAAHSASAAHSDTGWVIEQKSEERGRTVIRMTENSMVLTSKLMSAILTAPKFDAWFFNESTRKYVLMPHNDWMKRYAPGKKDMKGPFPGEKIAGYSTKKYTWQTKNRHKVMELWVTKELPLSAPLQEFVSSTIGIPQSIGMPLRMVSKFDDREPRIDMDTKSIKKTKIPKSAFELPKGFKKCKSEMELLLGGDDESGIDAFIK
ncbi:MAG: hypothetical protein DKT66_02235 [Candidatus Melainabacteria bacterium]|nr:MAG: hypothetical protein DKT66_02235 [Candidatus Melainabacteria bacterium]